LLDGFPLLKSRHALPKGGIVALKESDLFGQHVDRLLVHKGVLAP
jgi:hypothetical protein